MTHVTSMHLAGLVDPSDRVRDALRILVGLAAESVQSQLISALDDFQASFHTFKRQSALLDFDDLLPKACMTP
jgi:ATP-dependent exoDNAse (exonuclease V) beta subunit